MYVTAEVTAISVYYRKSVRERDFPLRSTTGRIVLIKSRSVYMINHCSKSNIFIITYGGSISLSY